MNENFKTLMSFVPEDNEKINWDLVENSFLKPIIEKYKNTHQRLDYHGEDDVWTHTKMVLEELINLPLYKKLDRKQKELVFTAALFHDLGKIYTTKKENGQWTSPFHASKGAKKFREFAWKELDLSGNKDERDFRETVALLIGNHVKPMHLHQKKNPEKEAIKLAANQELAKDFNLELLSILVEADMKGRISKDKKDSLETLELFREIIKDLGVDKKPASFPDDYSTFSYLNGKKIIPGQQLYDDTWGDIIMLAGLPASGKDTFIKNNYPNLPVISLDDIREELDISPKDKQGPVVRKAHEDAKELLRQRKPFIWNATSLTPELRAKQLRLFENYGASVKIIYLETKLEDLLKRNKERDRTVPEDVILDMIARIEPPQRAEAKTVEWIES